jgi:hypothetical protein
MCSWKGCALQPAPVQTPAAPVHTSQRPLRSWQPSGKGVDQGALGRDHGLLALAIGTGRAQPPVCLYTINLRTALRQLCLWLVPCHSVCCRALPGASMQPACLCFVVHPCIIRRSSTHILRCAGQPSNVMYCGMSRGMKYGLYMLLWQLQWP